MIRAIRIVIVVSLALSAMVAAYIDIEDEVKNWWRLGLGYYSTRVDPYQDSEEFPEANATYVHLPRFVIENELAKEDLARLTKTYPKLPDGYEERSEFYLGISAFFEDLSKTDRSNAKFCQYWIKFYRDEAARALEARSLHAREISYWMKVWLVLPGSVLIVYLFGERFSASKKRNFYLACLAMLYILYKYVLYALHGPSDISTAGHVHLILAPFLFGVPVSGFLLVMGYQVVKGFQLERQSSSGAS